MPSTSNDDMTLVLTSDENRRSLNVVCGRCVLIHLSTFYLVINEET